MYIKRSLPGAIKQKAQKTERDGFSDSWVILIVQEDG